MSSTLTGHRVARARRGGVLNFFSQAMNTWRQRQTLAQLDGHILKDIGLSARDAATEAQRPMWDVPLHWKR